MHIKVKYSIITFKKASQNQTTKINNAKPQLLLHHANTVERSLDSKEFQSVNPKGNPSWIFIGRTDAEAEAPILWPPDVKSWLTGKDPDAEKGWGQEGKRVTEDEVVGWHHWLYGHEFEQALGDGEGQGSLTCCNPWSWKELDMS